MDVTTNTRRLRRAIRTCDAGCIGTNLNLPANGVIYVQNVPDGGYRPEPLGVSGFAVQR